MNKKKERWGFTEAELKKPSTCNSFDEQIVTCDFPEFVTWAERGILVQRNGTVTTRYADGTKGVSDEERELIEGGEPAHYKINGNAESPYGNDLDVDTWRNVWTDKDGNFLGFVGKITVKVTIELDESSIGDLITLLNTELKDPNLSIRCAEAYNDLYRQLPCDSKPCGDHESMANRRTDTN